MRISARCDYACKALLELALHWPNKEPLQISEISNKQDIPKRYLVQILIQLKRLGWVESIRGKEGGYILASSPDKIRLGEIMRQVGGPLLPIAASIKRRESAFEKIWDEVEESIEKILGKVTFEDICKRIKGKESVIFYDI